MARGGARVGAGRKAGKGISFNIEKVSKAIELSPKTTPLAHMLYVMQDKNVKASVRLQAAIAAAPYVHPRLASIEMKTENNSALKIESDLGKALRELAEIARLRSTGPLIDAEVLEPSTMSSDDEDIMAVGQIVHADTVSNDDEIDGGDDDEAEEGGEERPEE